METRSRSTRRACERAGGIVGAVMLAFMVTPGCATIGRSEPVVSEDPVRVRRKTIPVDGVDANFDQDETTIHIKAKHVCGVQERHVFRRTTREENLNETPGVDWALGLLGAGATVTGSIMLADASNVYSTDKDSRTYNPTGPDKARLYGAGITTVGVACLGAAIIDVVRANGSAEDTQEITKPPVLGSSKVPCSIPFAKAKVTARVGETEVKLGETDERGDLDVDLDEALDQSFVPTPKGGIVISVEGEDVGEFDLAPLFSKREGRSWRGLSVNRCKEPSTADACDGLRAYLRNFPAGRHAAEGRAIWNEAQPKVARLAEAEAWKKLDLKACSTGSPSDDSHDVAGACGYVESFIGQYPNSEHVGEATAVLKRGKARQASLEAKFEARAREAEAKEERERKAEEARLEREAKAEEARQLAEKRRQEAEERRAEEKEMAECRADCRDVCIMARHRGERLAACVRLCVRNRCTNEEE
jgi:hypothetical protein